MLSFMEKGFGLNTKEHLDDGYRRKKEYMRQNEKSPERKKKRG